MASVIHSSAQMWKRYQDEERATIEESLLNFISTAQRNIEPLSTNKENLQDYARTKQAVVDALVKIRGKVQLKHERALKCQQQSLILATDNAIREESNKIKAEHIPTRQADTETLFSRMLSTKLINNSATSPPSAVLDEDDIQFIGQRVEQTAQWIQREIQRYINAKRQKAISAMSSEIGQLSSVTASAVGETGETLTSPQLQQELRRLMESSAKGEQEFWSKRTQHSDQVRELIRIYRRNMQLTAQISILKELQR